MIKFADQFLDVVKDYETIIVFRHINPDNDALGSQWATVSFLRLLFPEKKIYGTGLHQVVKGVSYPVSDSLHDEQFHNSIGIICDTANHERVDDQRYQLCKTIIRIDHHPIHDLFGDLLLINEQASSTCEILALMFRHIYIDPLPEVIATYLMAGILSDTIMFSIPSVSSKTFQAAAYLSQSPIKLSEIHAQLYHYSEDEFKFINELRSNIHRSPCGLAYVIVDRKMLEKHNMHPNKAKEYIFALSQVKEFRMWAIFIEIEVDGVSLYNGSLRSQSVVINTIANRFNGGGHPLAAAVKHLSLDQVNQLIEECCIKINTEEVYEK
jgi:bifunctional oligoribonuclease and PAP phosphatase NrnA